MTRLQRESLLRIELLKKFQLMRRHLADHPR